MSAVCCLGGQYQFYERNMIIATYRLLCGNLQLIHYLGGSNTIKARKFLQLRSVKLNLTSKLSILSILLGIIVGPLVDS